MLGIPSWVCRQGGMLVYHPGIPQGYFRFTVGQYSRFPSYHPFHCWLMFPPPSYHPFHCWLLLRAAHGRVYHPFHCWRGISHPLVMPPTMPPWCISHHIYVSCQPARVQPVLDGPDVITSRCRFYTFNHIVEHSSVPAGRKCPFSPQDIPLFPGETGV